MQEISVHSKFVLTSSVAPSHVSSAVWLLSEYPALHFRESGASAVIVAGADPDPSARSMPVGKTNFLQFARAQLIGVVASPPAVGQVRTGIPVAT